MKTAFVASMLLVACAAGAVDLNAKNFDAEVFGSGKAAFIKFLAPWWGHCKKMKPAWDQLGDEFKTSKTVIIGDVDCTVEKDLCSKYGVRGYPTIKYFTGSTDPLGDSYDGGRDYDALKKFADENLGPSCDSENKDLCDEDQLKKLEEIEALGAEKVAEVIKEKTAEIEAAEEDFKAEVEKLQNKYQDLVKAKDDKIAEVSPVLKLYRSVKFGSGEAPAKEEL